MEGYEFSGKAILGVKYPWHSLYVKLFFIICFK
jgi:hypothetical protein